MFEAMKEFFEVASNRVKSPILGMIALVYMGLNWKSVYILLFSSESAEKRLEFFEQSVDWKTGIAIPLFLGFVFAMLYPWLVLAGARLVSVPIGKYRDFQDHEKQARQISALKNQMKFSEVRAEIEAVDEQSIIDRAKRLEQVGQLKDPEVRNQVKNEIEELRNVDSPERLAVYDFLERDLSNEEGKDILISTIASNPAGIVSLHDQGATFVMAIGSVQFDIKNRRDYLRLRDAMTYLLTLSLVQENGANVWELTRDGYELAERLEVS